MEDTFELSGLKDTPSRTPLQCLTSLHTRARSSLRRPGNGNKKDVEEERRRNVGLGGEEMRTKWRRTRKGRHGAKEQAKGRSWREWRQ